MTDSEHEPEGAPRGRDLTLEDLVRLGELLEDLGDPDVMARAWE